MRSWLVLSALLTGSFGAGAQEAACSSNLTTLVAPDAESFEQLGAALDTDGARLVVAQGNGAAVRVYVAVDGGDDWALEDVLTAPMLGTDFGADVAIAGDRLVVTAPTFSGTASFAGRAYLYEFSGAWQLVQVLESSDLEAGDLFGASCAFDGTSLLVGASSEDGGGFGAGAVYSFIENGGTWNEEAKLIASDSGFGARFGASLDLDGDTFVVGAPGDSGFGFTSGGAYAYRRIGGVWADEERLVPVIPRAFNLSGTSVAVRGDFAIIGAPGRDFARGGGDLFERVADDWVALTPIGILPGIEGTRLGTSAAITDDYAVFGGPGDGASASGRLLLAGHDGSEWELIGPLEGSTVTPTSGFGAAVLLHGDRVIVGAPDQTTPRGTSVGAVAVERLGNQGRAYGSGSAGTGGFVPDLTSTGCIGIDDLLSFTVTEGLGGAFGFLLLARDEIAVPVAGIDLLVGGPLWIVRPHVLDGMGAGDGSIDVTFQWPTTPSSIRFVAQAVYADDAGTAGWSATQGRSFRLP